MNRIVAMVVKHRSILSLIMVIFSIIAVIFSIVVVAEIVDFSLGYIIKLVRSTAF